MIVNGTDVYSDVYSGVLQSRGLYPDDRLVFIDVQNETQCINCGLYSIPTPWVRVYIPTLPQLPGFMNLEISKF
jgi:hypothetical protein